jgi:hypothetical protein
MQFPFQQHPVLSLPADSNRHACPHGKTCSSTVTITSFSVTCPAIETTECVRASLRDTSLSTLRIATYFKPETAGGGGGKDAVRVDRCDTDPLEPRPDRRCPRVNRGKASGPCVARAADSRRYVLELSDLRWLLRRNPTLDPGTRWRILGAHATTTRHNPTHRLQRSASKTSSFAFPFRGLLIWSSAGRKLHTFLQSLHSSLSWSSSIWLLTCPSVKWRVAWARPSCWQRGGFEKT